MTIIELTSEGEVVLGNVPDGVSPPVLNHPWNGVFADDDNPNTGRLFVVEQIQGDIVYVRSLT